MFTVYGQLILKWRIVSYSSLPDGFYSKLTYLLSLLLDPYILSGFFSAFIASLFWMAAMTKFEVSYAYPIVLSGLLLLTSLLGIFLLGESIYPGKLAGIFLILLGVFVMYSGGASL